MNLHGCDFAVIGGGLVGATIARGIASAGLRVIVLDEGDLALRASRGNFALVWVQGKGSDMPRYAEWTRQSVSLWREFCTEILAETGLDVKYEQPGGFHLALSEQELEHLRATRYVGQPPEGTSYPPCEIMSAREIRSHLPKVGADVVGGSYCALDGHVNALRLFRAVHQAMITRGVQYRPNSRVMQIEFDGGFRLRLEGGGTIKAERVLLAAGLDNARLAPMVGLAAPVRSQRGQVLVTERITPFLNFPIATVRQTDEGSVLIGDSQEEAGLEGPATGIASVMASRAMRMFPFLARLKILRWWDCARVLSPDGYPIYDRSSSHPGAFLATCHSGVTLAAAHAKLLAPAILNGDLPHQLTAFSSRRFDVRANG